MEREIASEKEKNYYLEQRIENLKNEISYMVNKLFYYNQEIALKEKTN